MNDNQIIIIVIGILEAALIENGRPNVVVQQGYQPTQEGVPEQDAIILHKITNHRYGHVGQTDTFNTDNNNFDHKDIIWRDVKWQVNGRAQQDPTDMNAMTASDLVDLAADMLQLPSTRQALLASGIGIDRILDANPSYEKNEKDRFEQIPSFDFNLTYRKIYNSTVAAVTGLKANVHSL